MKKKWIRIAIIAVLILLPVIIHSVYQKLTALPNPVRHDTCLQGYTYRVFFHIQRLFTIRVRYFLRYFHLFLILR